MEIVVCTCENDGIGFKNTLPWLMEEGGVTRENLKEDLKLFRELTLGNVVVMGRKTRDSIAHLRNCEGVNDVLPNRVNVVISKSDLEGKTWREALFHIAHSAKNKRVFIIGGESIYQYALQHLYIARIHHTRIQQGYTCDSFFHLNQDWVRDMSVREVRILAHGGDGVANLTHEVIEKENRNEIRYLSLLRELLNAPVRTTRNARCHTLFGKTLEFSLLGGEFPLLTTKKMFLRGVFEELKFFLMGKTQTKELEARGVNIWRGNTCQSFLSQRGLHHEEGDMGPMYGFQWRNFNGQGVDQFAYVMKNLRENPMDRRHIMTSLNPLQVEEGVLWPCHGISIQFDCEPHEETYLLHCMMHQRSSDTFLGLPFNIASYALLVIIMANMLNYQPGKLIITTGNTHLYEEHLESVRTQIERKPRPFPALFCKRVFSAVEDITFDDFTLVGYDPFDKIGAPMIA